MAYTLMESTFIRYEGETSKFRVTIMVDTESKIPQPKPEWVAGSTCMIADTHTYKILNREREWT